MQPRSLTAEEIETVREFFTSDAAEALFLGLEQGLITDWINGASPDAREECWRQLQSLLVIKFSLRDAAAMKRMTQRAQERRVYQA